MDRDRVTRNRTQSTWKLDNDSHKPSKYFALYMETLFYLYITAFLSSFLVTPARGFAGLIPGQAALVRIIIVNLIVENQFDEELNPIPIPL